MEKTFSVQMEKKTTGRNNNILLSGFYTYRLHLSLKFVPASKRGTDFSRNRQSFDIQNID